MKKKGPIFSDPGGAHPKLAVEFAQIESERDVRRFTKKWGSLGWDGDSLGAWYGHADNVRLVLDLHTALTSADEDQLAALLSDEITVHIRERSGHPEGPHEMIFEPEGDSLPQRAEDIIAKALNACIAEVGVSQYRLEGHPLRMVSVCPTLLSAIYWHLGNLVAGGRPLARCQECGAPFIVTDRRQRFCPPPNGISDSRCAGRHRKRLSRATAGGRADQTASVGSAE